MLIYQKVFQTTKNHHSKLHIQSYICVAWWLSSPAMVGKLAIFEPSKSPWSNPEPHHCKISSTFVTAAHHSGFYHSKPSWDLPWSCHGVDMVFSTKNLGNPRKSSMNGGFHRGNQGIIPSEGWRSAPSPLRRRSEAAAPRSKPPSRASFQLPTGTIGTTFHVSWSLN